MDRNDLQTIAELRVKEAKILIENNHYNGAFYFRLCP